MNVIQKIYEKTESLEFYRLPALAGMLIFHGSITIPLSLWSMHLAGENDFQLMLFIISTMLLLVANLAALPTKITIPIFLIVTVLFIGFNIYNLSCIL